MPKLIGSPTAIASVGNIPKFADEYVGLTNTGDTKVSITRVKSPGGWIGVWQYSDYREYRVVLAGLLRVEHADGTMDVQAGQGLDVEPGEGVRYTTPDEGGADYVTVCLPAFSRARASGEVIADVYALYSAQASRRLRRSAHSAWDASSVPTTPVTFATFARRITVEMQC